MDREKVIKALEHCKDNQHVNDCDKCDYGGRTGMFCIRMIDDVLALLKEQETEIETLKQTCCDRNVESTGICSEAKEKQKIVRGKRANWVGFSCDEGILWINFLEGKQKLERYDE